MKMTYHVQYERIDRIANILATTGFGEIVHRMPAREGGRVRCITTTGVILIMDKSEEILITAYHASYKQAAAMYHGNTPRAIYKTIQSNYRRGYVL